MSFRSVAFVFHFCYLFFEKLDLMVKTAKLLRNGVGDVYLVEVAFNVISFDYSGSTYKGAVEDVCNLKGIPAITAEVLCPFANVARGSVERSFAQMKSFLSYFGV